VSKKTQKLPAHFEVRSHNSKNRYKRAVRAFEHGTRYSSHKLRRNPRV
jgi:hypothetical protein